MNSNFILIFGEYHTEQKSEHSMQLISKGSELAMETNCDLGIFCVTPDSNILSQDILSSYGVKYEWLFVTEKENYLDIARQFEKIITAMKPGLVLFPASVTGKAIASTLSARLGLGLTADCVDVMYQQNGFVFTRAALNDSILADIACINCVTNMGTIKYGVFKVKPSLCERVSPEIQVMNNMILNDKSDTYEVIKILNYNEAEKSHRDICSAKIVFGIGRGISKESTRNKLLKIAKKYHFGVAFTRAAVEMYSLSVEQQVGQSGISISPDIYVGFGISGACQHMVGLRNASTIIAINNDSNAPIFQYSNYSIIADANEIIDELYKKLIIDKFGQEGDN